MVTLKSVEKQLKRIGFSRTAWNRAETLELTNILMPDEEIYECVNGTYEGGIALLVATNVRLLLIDKKMLKFLTVEDLRFDLINQIDYSHRMIGARISVSAGLKNLKFSSLNQQRLRKLIGHVQHCMAEVKKQQSTNAATQGQHLEQINQQLQAYLLAQHQQQEELRRQLQTAQSNRDGAAPPPTFEPVKPDPQLSDFLYAQTLLANYRAQGGSDPGASGLANNSAAPVQAMPAAVPAPLTPPPLQQLSPETDLYADARAEVFGKRAMNMTNAASQGAQIENGASATHSLEINPLRIAYSKLPMALRNRSFARRSGLKRILQTGA